MSEPTDPHLIREPLETVHFLENKDAQVLQLRAERQRLADQFRNNQAVIAEGGWGRVEPYQLPEYIPFNPQNYVVDITRRGEFVSRRPDQFPHIPQRHELPGVVKLTLGDLDAAAEWEMVPELNPTSQRRPEANRLRQLVEDVTYQAVMRRIFLARLHLSSQIWDGILADRDAGAAWSEVLQHSHTKPLEADTMQHLLVQPSSMAERIMFTLGARLGSKVQPPFRAFRARAGVDRYEHVDLLMRVEPAGEAPRLVGIDVTHLGLPEELWGKSLVQQSGGRSAVRGTLRDPSTLDAHLPVHRTVVSAKAGIEWPRVLAEWQHKRAHTMVTPEYFLRPDQRIYLARRLLAVMKQTDEVPYYTFEGIDQAYQATYGQSVGY